MTVNLLVIAGIVGALLPLLIAAVVQSRWSNAVKANISLILALIAAAVTVLVDHGWEGLTAQSGRDFATAAVPLVLANWAAYRGYWIHSPLVRWIDRVTTWAARNHDAVTEVLQAVERLDPAGIARLEAGIVAVKAAIPPASTTPVIPTQGTADAGAVEGTVVIVVALVLLVLVFLKVFGAI